MYFLTDLCFLCLVHSKNIKSVLSHGDDDIIIEEKLKCILSELVNFLPEIPKNICTDCLKGLNYVYKFKQKCLQNLISLSDYLEKMTENMTLEHFLSTFTEVQYENEQQCLPDKHHMEINSAVHSISDNQIRNDEVKGELSDQNVVEYHPVDALRSENVRSSVTSTAPENTKTAQNQNKITRNQTKQYKCRDCHKFFNSSILLGNHRQIHNNDRNKCSTCQKTFKRPEHLKTHERTHTGERPYACEVCFKTFTAQSNYISHKRIHSNVQPFKCSVCNKSFFQSNNLIMHMRVHTGDKPFQCHLCEFKCTQSNNLKIHIRTHTEDTIVSCEHCEVRFVSANHLLEHVRMKH